MIEATYDQRAHDLARYLPDPVDDIIALVVAAGASPHELTELDCYKLLHFAQRRAAHALREHDVDAARQAVTALTLIDRDRIDWRDLSVDFPLYAAVETGMPLDAVIDQAAVRSLPGTAAVFEAARSRTLTLAGCRLLPVRTHYGLGLLTITETYDARSGLAEKAIALADAIDTEGTYGVSTLATSRLPAVWFDSRKRAAHVRSPSCISIHAERIGAEPWSHGLLIFLAQVRNPRTAAKLIAQLRDASSPRRPRAGLTEDDRLFVIIGGSSRTDDESLETELSLARFTELYASIQLSHDV